MKLARAENKDKEKKTHHLLSERVTIKANGVSYTTHRVIGHGSFGVVFQATVDGTGEVIAIKKVLQDKRFKNRELQIMRLLDHPNIVALKNSFYTNGDKPDEVYLNLVLEYVPDTVYRVARHYSKLKQSIPILYVKLYMYQVLRALSYTHALGICHRDIKPQNLLLDPQTSILKLCDFGSAKILVKGEPNVSYICSRYYRAPELIFGATIYSPAIDIWSMGCVMAELLLGQPLFPGESGVDQLIEIIKVLGTPTKEQIQSMNQNYTDFKFPQIKPHSWNKVFMSRTPEDAIDLISKLLQYNPAARLTPLQACGHRFFDELRSPNTRLPNGRAIPSLFNFTSTELAVAGELCNILIPPHMRCQLDAAAQAAFEQATGIPAVSPANFEQAPSTNNIAAAQSASSSNSAPESAPISAAINPPVESQRDTAADQSSTEQPAEQATSLVPTANTTTADDTRVDDPLPDSATQNATSSSEPPVRS